MNQPKTAKSRRLQSLDILRGITIAGMIMVNNPGSWSHIYAPLEHASWNGLTPTDLVFPFFMFIMGVSMYFSLRKYNFSFSWPAIVKIVRRTIVIFAIGLGIVWFGRILRGALNPDVSVWDVMFDFSTIRILGVMPRLALCYGISAIIAITLRRKHIAWLIALTLCAYAIIIMTSYGYEFSERNVIAVVDRAILGENHMYADTIDGVRLKFDPEGLLSTLPSIAHCLIGFLCGWLIVTTKDNLSRTNKLFIIGAILTFSGFLLSYLLPINKKIWSPTFVLTTCGMASTLLALLIWIIDIRGHKKWCRFFEAFGVNPLFMYVLGSVFSIVLSAIKVNFGDESISIHSLIYNKWLVPMCGDETFASLCFALLLVGSVWCCGYVLYRKKIYIKI